MNQLLVPFKAIIFDFDDTILATFDVRCKSLAAAAADFGYALSIETIRAHWGKPFRDLICSMLPGIEFERFEPHYRQVMLNIPPIPTPGARELLAELSVSNVVLSITSSSANRLIWQDLEQTGLARYFSFVYGSDDTQFHKPDPRVLHPALQRLAELEICKDEIILIGDSIRDFKVAHGNFISFLGVTTGQESEADLLAGGVGKQWIVPSLQYLVDQP